MDFRFPKIGVPISSFPSFGLFTHTDYPAISAAGTISFVPFAMLFPYVSIFIVFILRQVFTSPFNREGKLDLCAVSQLGSV